eukprot:15263731-Alexandrium_andersonii.AAC.1
MTVSAVVGACELRLKAREEHLTVAKQLLHAPTSASNVPSKRPKVPRNAVPRAKQVLFGALCTIVVAPLVGQHLTYSD